MRWICLLAALLLAACANTQSAPPAPAWEPLGVDNADYIRLGEGPCFGSCPVYELTLYPGGQYVLFGQRFTEGEDRSDNKPAEDSFEMAQAILRAAGFMELPETITPENPQACPMPATDLPTADITLGRADGFYRRVTYYQGCFHDVAESMLRQLRGVMRIEDLVQAAEPGE